MIRVSIGNNLKRDTIVVDEATTTLRTALQDNGISLADGMIYLNSAPVCGDELDKTFADYGITDSCYLLNVFKRDNA